MVAVGVNEPAAAYRRHWRFFADHFKGFGFGIVVQTDEYGHEFEITFGPFAIGGVYE